MPRQFEEELDVLKQQSLLRRLREVESQPGTVMSYAGRELVNFSSNDYLGLAGEPFLKEAAKRAIDEYGVGATASRLVCGTLSPHLALEQKLAEFKRTEAALSFSSGYATALGTLNALAGKEDVIILDKLAHASLIDGARLSGAVIRVFPHNQVEKLESHLEWARQEHPKARVVVVTESVFSMDGDRAPLAEIVEAKDRFGALLMLDEAHAVGVVGANGRGLSERLGLAGRIDIQMGTLSKALGGLGGFVACSDEMRSWFIHKARSFIYSTALSTAMVGAALGALEVLREAPGMGSGLLARSAHFRNRLQAQGLDTGASASQIIPVMVGDNGRAIRLHRRLLEQGILAVAIRPPTVPRGTARLRLSVRLDHSLEVLDRVADQIAAAAKAEGVIP